MADSHHKSDARLRKSKTCTERYITVNTIHYAYRLKDQLPSSGDRKVPWIQMRGHWLERAGFCINTPVKVRVMDGCLVLTTAVEATSE